jgi:hypothetical protein
MGEEGIFAKLRERHYTGSTEKNAGISGTSSLWLQTDTILLVLAV